MKAIVYTSYAGHTKRYAEMLSQRSGLPVYELKDAGSRISKGEEIIYLGWIFAGSISGYSKAASRYNVRLLCAVGMGQPDGKQIAELAGKYGFPIDRAFYLQGGFDMQNLHGIYKLMMSTFAGLALEKKSNKSSDEIEMLNLYKTGGDFVREENLIPILNRITHNPDLET